MSNLAKIKVFEVHLSKIFFFKCAVILKIKITIVINFNCAIAHVKNHSFKICFTLNSDILLNFKH